MPEGLRALLDWARELPEDYEEHQLALLYYQLKDDFREVEGDSDEAKERKRKLRMGMSEIERVLYGLYGLDSAIRCGHEAEGRQERLMVTGKALLATHGR